MPVSRHFLGWDAPLTGKVCDYLLDGRETPPIDLGDCLILVPTQQAGRRLREALARRADERGTGLLSPRIANPRELLTFHRPPLPPAPPTVVSGAWVSVLLKADLERFPALFPLAPPQHNFAWASNLSVLLQNLSAALAEGGHSVASVISQFGNQLAERDRWRDLASLEGAYLKQLAKLGFGCPNAIDRDAATNVVLPPEIGRVIVASVADLSPLLASALDRVPNAELLIHAPENRSDLFDEWGRPKPEAWSGEEIPINDASLILAGTPAGQSRQAIEAMLDPNLTAIGVPDRDVTPFLAAALGERGLKAYDPAGRALADHPIFQLLAALRDLVRAGDAPAFARWLRQADVLEHVDATGRVLAEWDEFQNEFLPADFRDIARRFRSGHSAEQRYPNLFRAVQLAAQIEARFSEEDLAGAVRETFQRIYALRQIHPGQPRDDAFLSVARKLNEALEEIGQASELKMKPGDALDLLIQRLEGESYYPDRSDAAIDLEGWLELAWSEAPDVIVTGLNEGIVPDSRCADVFLPDRLRTELGLRNEAQRAARDAFLLRSLVESRAKKGRATLIVGKSSAAGEPLRPSRLLFRCPDGQLVNRSRKLFGDPGEPRDQHPAGVSFKLDPNRISAPPLARLSVTMFRSYLACPFRFYLKHILKMEAMDDRKSELEELDFGTLIHSSLQLLHGNPVGKSADPAAVADFLTGTFDELLSSKYGSDLTLQMIIQREAGRQRLRAAARWLAQSTAEGWILEESEKKITVTLAGMEVKGSIDRVERHRETGRWRLLDYKTSDLGVSPVEAHVAPVRDDTPDYANVVVDDKPRRWIDLQLPLYAHLLGGDEVPLIGYFNMPKAVTETGIEIWPDFDAATLQSARRCTEAIIGEIKAGHFWPPSDSLRFDEFENLLFGKAAEYAEEPRS